MYSKVEGHKNLIRDENTKAVLNTNTKEYNLYLNAKRVKERENETVKKLEYDLNELKNDMDEIKNLLRNLINGSKWHRTFKSF